MGYPIGMINKDTLLHSYIGVNAIEEDQSEKFNGYFKEANFNAKVMPLNIREDDIGFFIHGFKDSQVKSAYFSKEYWSKLHHLLEEKTKESQICGMCDTMEVVNKQNIGSISYGKACVSMIQEDQTIAIYGNSPTSKSILYNIVRKSPKMIILADMVVENCLEMMKLIPDNIQNDIQRVTVDELKADMIVDSTTSTVKINHKILKLDDIIEKIAQIKTKKWIENG